jgi:hypothetical protein
MYMYGIFDLIVTLNSIYLLYFGNFIKRWLHYFSDKSR